MVDKVQADLWTELRANVPDELLQSSRLLMQAEPEQLSAWLRDRIALGLSTGPHDSDHVHPVEVGNGLQSILDVALSIAALPRDMRQTVLAIEEPEAFLHPSAQRTVAGHLRQLGSATQGAQVDVLVTSHSPYLVEEARFGETILVRNHRFYRPTLDATDAQRAEINTALMTVPSAEVFFARGLLLVEGEGDRALFQTLLRRIQSATRNPCLNQLVVHAVGGKKAFAPWWRLLASYGRAGDRPIRWLSVFDADAASNEGGERALLRGLADAGTTLDTEARDLVIALGDLLYSDSVARLTAARKANERLAEHDVFLFSVDSEWASFGALATTHGDAVADILEFHGDRTTDAAERLARAAGSKISTGKASQDAKKHPFRRQKLASLIPLDAIPLELKQVLLQWFELVMPSHDAAALLSGNLGSPAPVSGARRRR